MATTDTRSGFRLPWSSDRSRDEAPTDTQPAVDDPAANVVALDADLPDGSDGSDGSDLATADETWPEIDVNARLHQLGDETAPPPPPPPPPPPKRHARRQGRPPPPPPPPPHFRGACAHG